MSNDVKEPRSRPAEVVEGLRTLRVKDLALSLAIPVWRIYAMVKQGKAPPHFTIGKTVRFHEVAVRRWLEEQTSNGNHKEKEK